MTKNPQKVHQKCVWIRGQTVEENQHQEKRRRYRVKGLMPWQHHQMNECVPAMEATHPQSRLGAYFPGLELTGQKEIMGK